MYLLKTNLNSIPSPDLDSDIIKKFYEDLDSNKIHVYFKIDSSNKEILYFISDSTYGSCSFFVDSDGFVELYRVYNSQIMPSIDLGYALVYYLHEKESKMSQDKLKELYSEIYEEEIIKKGMTQDQIKAYDNTKDKFKDFLSSLNKNKENIEENVNYLYFKLVIDNRSQMDEFELIAYENGKKLNLSFFSIFDRYILNERPLNEEAKNVLIALSPLYGYLKNDRYMVNDFYKKILGQCLKVLKNQKCNKQIKSFSFEGKEYYLDNEVRNIEVSIDKDGNITLPLLEKDGSFYYDFNNSKEILFFDKEKETVFFFNTHTETEKKLLLFKIDNPMFNTKYFEKEISQNLVPTVKNSIQIEPTFLSKSMMKIDHIAYYIDLDKDKLQLICKTLYFMDGKEVTLDEFKTKHQNKYDDFYLAYLSYGLCENGIVDNIDTIAEFSNKSFESLKSTCEIFISEDVKKLKKKPVAKINIIVNSNQDWFSIQFQSNEYSEEEIESILSAYKKEEKYYRFKDEILTLDEGDGKDMISLMNDFDVSQEKIPVYQALKLKARQNVTLSKELKELFDKIQNYEDQELHLDQNLKNILRPYQIKGIQWLTVLKQNHLSGILADDMGLGKTLEMIAFLSQFHENKPNLVVSPKSLTFNWEDEFHKWNPNAKVVVLSSGKDDRHNKLSQMKSDEEITYIISYDSLRIDLDLFKGIEFGFLILDEGQYISNSFSLKSKAVKQLAADYKFALTGTPIQNSLMDLWSLFDFLMPGYLKSFKDFKRLYGKFDLDNDDRKHLENIVSPFLLKRKKDDVLTELPGKIILTQSLVMDDKERVLYEAYLSKARNAMHAKKSEGKKNGIEVLAALTRLRQLCVDPSSFLEYKNISTKLDYTLMLIKEAISKDHKILLFSSFTSVLDRMCNLLDKEKITYGTIQGDTSASKRLKLVKEFNTKDDIKVMLISLKAGGTGLNLIGADIVIHLDPWWNVAAEEQASDRAYRIGQKRKVTIYKLVMKNTIEEKVLNLQDKKKDLSDIFDNINSKTALSDDDIQYLLE